MTGSRTWTVDSVQGNPKRRVVDGRGGGMPQQTGLEARCGRLMVTACNRWPAKWMAETTGQYRRRKAETGAGRPRLTREGQDRRRQPKQEVKTCANGQNRRRTPKLKTKFGAEGQDK